MSEDRLRESIKRFCRTEEAVDNLMKVISTHTEALINKARIEAQHDVIDLINKEVVKPIEGRSWLEIRADLVVNSLVGCLNKLRRELKSKQKEKK